MSGELGLAIVGLAVAARVSRRLGVRFRQGRTRSTAAAYAITFHL